VMEGGRAVREGDGVTVAFFAGVTATRHARMLQGPTGREEGGDPTAHARCAYGRGCGLPPEPAGTQTHP
jgi:hypothetical protein